MAQDWVGHPGYATEEWRCDTQTMEAALASVRAIGGEPVALKARHNILLVMSVGV